MDYIPEPTCTSCTESRFPYKLLNNPWPSTWAGLLVFVLPKCPFCVVAYTSSMTVCGAPSIVSHHTGWGAWLVVGMAFLCLASIVRNYRGRGTRTAVGIGLLGIILLVSSLFVPDAMTWYYVGAVLLVLGSVYNGPGYRWFHSLLFLTRRR